MKFLTWQNPEHFLLLGPYKIINLVLQKLGIYGTGIFFRN